ncbi:MAG: methyltransferase domain-containing protein [Actinobacteria bacterium]|nr:methyltransferase domain-containing protein [Actinomycetota bacterium]
MQPRARAHGSLSNVAGAAHVLRAELRTLLRHRRGVRAARKLDYSESLLLNLGCGTKVKPGWLNVDLVPEADLTLDLREPFPFPNGCAAATYCEHVFEHFDYPGAAERFLEECHRVLHVGGTISIGVPDTERILREYVTGGDEWFALWRRLAHPSWCHTHLDQVNFHFRQIEEHRYAYDGETLLLRLAAAGFADGRVRPFDPALDSEDRRLGTLYVEATRV